MEKKAFIKKILAVSGSVLVLLPILITVVLSAAGSIARGMFLFDYLMPAELFFIVLAGALLLLGVSLWSRLFRPAIITGAALAVLAFFLMQFIAFASGLASGDTQPGGWAWYTVLGMLVLYAAAEIELGVAGIVLSKKLFLPKPAEE